MSHKPKSKESCTCVHGRLVQSTYKLDAVTFLYQSAIREVAHQTLTCYSTSFFIYSSWDTQLNTPRKCNMLILAHAWSKIICRVVSQSL